MCRKLTYLISCIVLLGAVSGAQAAVLTITPTAPEPGALDIANLVGSVSDADNVGTELDPPYANDATTYIAHDRGGQGQTFITGANEGGYVMTGVWVRHVVYTTAVDQTWYRMQAGSQLYIRVTNPAASGTDDFVLSDEIYEVTGQEENALPSTTTNTQTGTGLWFHVTLDTPVALAANTEYGFDLTSISGLAGVLFFETMGIRDGAVGGNPYTQGSAYVTGSAGVADNVLTAAPGDRVFVVELAKPAPKIIYVTSVKDQDKNGVQDDLSWVDWLKAQGYRVDARPGNWNDPLDANEIAELNAADLIIASRAMATGDFDGAETPKWNSLSTPIICTNAWMIRNSRWKWMNNNTANKDAGAPLMMVLDANHPIFAGVTLDPDGLVEVLDPNAGSGSTSFLTDFLDPGNGKLLAQSLGKYNTAWIVEWAKGVEYYAGAVEKAGGERLLFMAGTQDDTFTLPDGNMPPVGVFNLNAAGQKMFLNAIAYMLQFKPQDPGKEGLVAAYELENNANDSSDNGLNGTLMGEPNFVEGVAGMAMAFDGVNDYVDCGDDPNHFNMTTAITLAAWVKPDISPSKDEPFIQNGDEVGIKIKKNDTLEVYIHGSDLLWYVANIPGAEMNAIYGDGEWHHVAGTYDSADNGAGSATLKLYVDGVLKATNTSPSVIPVGTMINVTTFPVNIGRDSAHVDRLYKGALDDVRIYDRALSAREVLYLAGR